MIRILLIFLFPWKLDCDQSLVCSKSTGKNTNKKKRRASCMQQGHLKTREKRHSFRLYSDARTNLRQAVSPLTMCLFQFACVSFLANLPTNLEAGTISSVSSPTKASSCRKWAKTTESQITAVENRSQNVRHWDMFLIRLREVSRFFDGLSTMIWLSVVFCTFSATRSHFW